MSMTDKELVLRVLQDYSRDKAAALQEASTLEALEAIPVDYDSVPLPGGETA